MNSWMFTLAGRITLGRRGALGVRDLSVQLRDLDLDYRDGMVTVDGRLTVLLAYVGRDGRVRESAAAGSFRRVISADAAAGDSHQLRVRVEAVQHELRYLPGRAWGREVDYQVDLSVDAAPVRSGSEPFRNEEAEKAERTEKAEKVTPSLQPRSRLIRVDEVIGDNQADFLLEQRLILDLPAVRVIDAHGAVTDLRAEALENTVILWGALFLQAYYVGEDRLIHYQNGDMVFEETINVPGARPGMNVQALARVRAVDHEPPDGQWLLEKIDLQVDVKVTRTVDVDIITDLAAPPDVQVAADLINVEQVIGRGEMRHLAESAVRLAVPADRVTRIAAIAGPTSVQVVEDKVVVDGIIQKQLYYVGRDGMEYHQAEDVPFSAFIEVPGARNGMQAQVEVNVEGVESDLGARDNRLHQKMLLRLAALVTEAVSLRIVTAVTGPGVDVDTRPLKVERLVTQNAAQVMIVRKAALVSRAIRVVDVIGSVQDLVVEVIPDQVIIQGRVHQQVFFVDQRKVQRHQTEDAAFNHLIEAPGARPGMCAQVRPFVKYISTVLSPEANALTEKIVLDLQVKVMEPVALTAVTDVRLVLDGTEAG